MEKDYQKSYVAGGVVINSAGQVLVVNQQGDSWSLPKGHVEAGESVVEAARREIYEETGIAEVELIRPLGTYERFRIGKDGLGEDHSELKEIAMFLFRAMTTAVKPIDGSITEARWVHEADVVPLLTHPKDREFFQSVSAILGSPTS